MHANAPNEGMMPPNGAQTLELLQCHQRKSYGTVDVVVLVVSNNYDKIWIDLDRSGK